MKNTNYNNKERKVIMEYNNYYNPRPSKNTEKTRKNTKNNKIYQHVNTNILMSMIKWIDVSNTIYSETQTFNQAIFFY